MSKTTLESIRRWLKAKTMKERGKIAKSVDYPIDSINKFVCGTVADPGYLRISALIRYKAREKK